MAKKTQAEKISSMPIEKIIGEWNKTGGKQKVRGYLRTLQSGYKRRVSQFVRQGLVSYAQIQYENSLPIGYKAPSPKTANYNTLILEIARLQNFFQSQTSSAEGIKQVQREQDARIFGTDSKGRPKRRMTQQEREKFWELYEEYQNQRPNATSRYGSETVQQQIADALFQDSIAGDNLIELLNRVEAQLAENALEQDLRSMPNVYSGRGPFRT